MSNVDGVSPAKLARLEAAPAFARLLHPLPAAQVAVAVDSWQRSTSSPELLDDYLTPAIRARSTTSAGLANQQAAVAIAATAIPIAIAAPASASANTSLDGLLIVLPELRHTAPYDNQLSALIVKLPLEA